MRVAFVIEEVNREGGQERVVAELVTRLCARHEVHLYGLSARDIPRDRIAFHRVRCPVRPLSLRAMLFPGASAGALRGQQYDAVVAQGGNCPAATFSLLHTCHARRIRAVRREIWPRHAPSAKERLQAAVLDPFKLRSERRTAARCRGRLIAVSSGLRDDFCSEYDLQEEDLLVAPNGVDLRAFRPVGSREEQRYLRRSLGLPEHAFLVLFVGGIWYEKGLDHLIEAVGRCARRPTLVVVGGGPEEEFRKLAARARAQDRVFFAGRTTRIAQYYRAADCAAVPSHAEGCSLAALEAAASGLPVVMTPTGVARDLIEDGVSGYIVSLEAEALAARLDRLGIDAHLRETMGGEARLSAERFTWDAQAKMIEAFLEERVAGARPGSGARGPYALT